MMCLRMQDSFLVMVYNLLNFFLFCFDYLFFEVCFYFYFSGPPTCVCISPNCLGHYRGKNLFDEIFETAQSRPADRPSFSNGWVLREVDNQQGR